MTGEELFYHPAVLKVIRKDVAEATAIVRLIANRDVMDAARKRRRRAKSNTGTTGNPDAHAQEPGRTIDTIDQERMLAAIRKNLKDHEIEAIIDVQSGEPHAKLAAERNISPGAHRKETQRARGKARRSLGPYAAAGGFAALLAGIVAIYIGAFQREDDVARGRPREPTADASREQQAREIAQEQRRIAADACKARDWDACERALDRAAQVDPEGDRGAEVKAMREMVAAGRRGRAD